LIVDTTFFNLIRRSDHEYTGDYGPEEKSGVSSCYQEQDGVEEEGWFQTILVLGGVPLRDNHTICCWTKVCIPSLLRYLYSHHPANQSLEPTPAPAPATVEETPAPVTTKDAHTGESNAVAIDAERANRLVNASNSHNRAHELLSKPTKKRTHREANPYAHHRLATNARPHSAEQSLCYISTHTLLEVSSLSLKKAKRGREGKENELQGTG